MTCTLKHSSSRSGELFSEPNVHEVSCWGISARDWYRKGKGTKGTIAESLELVHRQVGAPHSFKSRMRTFVKCSRPSQLRPSYHRPCMLFQMDACPQKGKIVARGEMATSLRKVLHTLKYVNPSRPHVTF